jgi:hypothetical protein
MIRSDSSRTEIQPASNTLFGAYVAALAVSVIGNLGIRLALRTGALPEWVGAVLGAAVAIPLIVAALKFWRLLRRDLDEMLQRIVLEGLAFAVIVYVPLTALYVNLRTAGVGVPRLDPQDLLMIPAFLVVIGITLANRRYQ